MVTSAAGKKGSGGSGGGGGEKGAGKGKAAGKAKGSSSAASSAAGSSEARKQRNRESALRSRQRKQALLSGARQQILEVAAQRESIRTRVAMLREHNAALRVQIASATGGAEAVAVAPPAGISLVDSDPLSGLHSLDEHGGVDGAVQAGVFVDGDMHEGMHELDGTELDLLDGLLDPLEGVTPDDEDE